MNRVEQKVVSLLMQNFFLNVKSNPLSANTQGNFVARISLVLRLTFTSQILVQVKEKWAGWLIPTKQKLDIEILIIWHALLVNLSTSEELMEELKLQDWEYLLFKLIKLRHFLQQEKYSMTFNFVMNIIYQLDLKEELWFYKGSVRWAIIMQNICANMVLN